MAAIVKGSKYEIQIPNNTINCITIPIQFFAYEHRFSEIRYLADLERSDVF